MSDDSFRTDGGDEKVQKNLNIRPSYANALEEMAEDIYSSRYAQGRVIEDLIDLTTYKPVNTQIQEALTEAAADSPVVSSDVVGNESGESSRKGENRVDPRSHKDAETPEKEGGSTDGEGSEIRISNIKGDRSVNRGKVVAEFVKESMSEPVTKGDVKNVVMEEAGYGRTGAYNVADEAVKHFVPSPLNGAELNQWAKNKSEDLADHTDKRSSSFAEFAGVSEEKISRGVWFFTEQGAKDAYQQAMVRIRIGDAPKERKRAAFERLAELRPEYVDESWVESERETFEETV